MVVFGGGVLEGDLDLDAVLDLDLDRLELPNLGRALSKSLESAELLLLRDRPYRPGDLSPDRPLLPPDASFRFLFIFSQKVLDQP